MSKHAPIIVNLINYQNSLLHRGTKKETKKEPPKKDKKIPKKTLISPKKVL